MITIDFQSERQSMIKAIVSDVYGDADNDSIDRGIAEYSRMRNDNIAAGETTAMLDTFISEMRKLKK